MNNVQRVLVFWVCAFIGLFLLIYFQDLPATVSSRIEIDAIVASGSEIEVYINRDYYYPYRVSIAPGEPKVYVVKDILKQIRELRIDMGKIDGAAIEIRRIDVFAGDQRALHFGPDRLLEMITSQQAAIAGPPERTADGIRYIQKGAGPSFVSEQLVPLNASGLTGSVAEFLGDVQSVHGLPLYSLIGLGIALVATRSLYVIIALGTGAVTALLTMVLVPIIASFNFAPDLVRDAVGRAAYVGRAAVANQAATLATFAVALSFSLVMAFALGRWVPIWSATSGTGANLDPPTPGAFRTPVKIVAALCAVAIYCYFLGNLVGFISYTAVSVFSGHWDGDNHILWSYLVQSGYRPLIDFWYPYSGQWLFYLSAPWGPLILALYNGSVYALLFVSLFRLFEFRLQAAMLITLAVMTGETISLFPWATRYLTAIDVVLGYAAIGGNRVQFHPGHLLFLSAQAIALIFEPFQLFYAAPGVLAVVVRDVIQAQGGSLKQWTRRALIEVGSAAVVTAAVVAALWYRGELAATIAFSLSIPVAAIYGSIPSDIVGSLRDGGITAGNISLIAPGAMAAIGLLGCVQRNRSRQTGGLVVFILGLMALMLVQKSVVRDISAYVLLPVFLGLMVWAALEPELRKTIPMVLAALIVAMVAFATRTTASNVMVHLVSGPVGTIESLYQLATSPEPAATAVREAFAPQKFVNYRAENEVVARLRSLGAGLSSRVFVLGDAPVLYVLLGQAPPYQSNDYNASPLVDQTRVLDWLSANKPAFVVWRPTDLMFDGFARAVRVPLIYGAIAADYVPLEDVAGYTILRRRVGGESPALDWWRGKLGATIDLGSILRRTGIAQAAECATDRSACMTVLRVEVPSDLLGTRIVLPVVVANREFQIVFTSYPGQNKYYIALEHMWFWPTALAYESEPKLGAATDPRIVIQELSKAGRATVLY